MLALQFPEDEAHLVAPWLSRYCLVVSSLRKLLMRRNCCLIMNKKSSNSWGDTFMIRMDVHASAGKSVVSVSASTQAMCQPGSP